MSPKLPLNRCIARIIGVDPNELGSELFWRGDVVGMKFEPESEHSFMVQCYDADASAIVALGNSLVDDYGAGKLEKELSSDEEHCKRENVFTLPQKIDPFTGKFHYRRGTTSSAIEGSWLLNNEPLHF
jgi:hypothetical protein